MYRVLAIGDQDFCAGFALAGVETKCATHDNALAALNAARANELYGVIIVEEHLGQTLEEENASSTASTTIPVIVAVPGELRWRNVAQPDSDSYVKALIRRAVGYQLDINL